MTAGKSERHNLDVVLNQMKNCHVAVGRIGVDASPQPAWLPRQVKWNVDRGLRGYSIAIYLLRERLCDLQHSIDSRLREIHDNECELQWSVNNCC